MKKLILLLFLSFFVAFSYTSNAACKLPAGVSNTPAWTEGTPKMAVEYVAGNDHCTATYSWCWRILPNGDKEIALGDISFGDDCNWWENITDQCDCEREFRNKKELLMDFAIGAIAIEYDKFGIVSLQQECDQNGNPPANSPHVFKVYTSKCETVPYPDYLNNGGKVTISPCTGEGYCKYEYKYCYKTVNGALYSTYTRTVVDGTSSQCPTNELVAPQLWKDCVPKDCYQNRIGIKLPALIDVQQAPSSDIYYLTNSL